MTRSITSFTPDAVVAGYLGVDIAPGFPAGRPAIPAVELFRPGRLIEAKGLEFSLGGVVANTGLAMKHFGQRVELMGCVGCDALGDIVTAQLAAHGVARGIRKHPRAGTAYGIVIAPPGPFHESDGIRSERRYIIYGRLYLSLGSRRDESSWCSYAGGMSNNCTWQTCN